MICASLDPCVVRVSRIVSIDVTIWGILEHRPCRFEHLVPARFDDIRTIFIEAYHVLVEAIQLPSGEPPQVVPVLCLLMVHCCTWDATTQIITLLPQHVTPQLLAIGVSNDASEQRIDTQVGSPCTE